MLLSDHLWASIYITTVMYHVMFWRTLFQYLELQYSVVHGKIIHFSSLWVIHYIVVTCMVTHKICYVMVGSAWRPTVYSYQIICQSVVALKAKRVFCLTLLVTCTTQTRDALLRNIYCPPLFVIRLFTHTQHEPGTYRHNCRVSG